MGEAVRDPQGGILFIRPEICGERHVCGCQCYVVIKIEGL
jgi:hypothetical protein